MSDHILKLLAKRKENSLKRKASFRKMKEQEFDRKTESVKGILGGKPQYSAVPVELTVLRDLYFTMLRAYTGRVQYYAEGMSDTQVAIWIRVEKARREADCDPDRFIKAQFAWFDKAFGTYPNFKQLATETAVERAMAFEGSTEGKVLGNVRAAPVTKADTFRESEKLLQKMMTAQKCGREEFYRKFVLTGVYTFPKEFLEADPSYKKATEGIDVR